MVKSLAFFGSAQVSAGHPDFQEAQTCARVLAEHGYAIVNGGGPGIMLAATLGAREAGGKVTTVLCNTADMSFFDPHTPENQGDKVIVTKNYQARTAKMIKIADAFVVFNGGTGTLSELGMVWGLARLYYDRFEPLFFYGSFWYAILETMGKYMYFRPEELKVYRIVTCPEHILTHLAQIKSFRNQTHKP